MVSMSCRVMPMNASTVRPQFRRWASRCGAAALVLSLLGATMDRASAEDSAPADAPTTRFDGVWQTTLSCPNSHGALGYSFRFPSIVKAGVLHGEKGNRGEPGWLQVDGSINADGKATLYVDGLVGAADFAVGRRPAGTGYGYHIAAAFTVAEGEGHRTEGRECSVVWKRQQ